MSFPGPKADLPTPTPRRYAPYLAAEDLEAKELVRHAIGYERVAQVIGSPDTSEALCASVYTHRAALSDDELAVYLGNWLIWKYGRGGWAHVIAGRPEVSVGGVGLDVMSMARRLKAGDTGSFMNACFRYPHF